ncbi:CBP4 [Geosmithia morbida]|uniref:Cytochrome b mRNA-processing protein 4 n=1 Tax=Geosmithia morbida TaxID=1094350 RepID=A0A9P5D5J3_9HYPO|nr:CBP4 [Geosmithia morbida]KAF4124606.1 CBP4 [Geosmithia morbida]
MGKKPTNWNLWGKVIAAGLVAGIGGPMFTSWVTPTEDEIRAKYNPDLRRRSLEGRAAREQEFDEFVTKLKEYSKSDKPIWVVAKEDRERQQKKAIEDAKTRDIEAAARREEMRRQAGLGGAAAPNDAAVTTKSPEAPVGADQASQGRGWFSWLGWR